MIHPAPLLTTTRVHFLRSLTDTVAALYKPRPLPPNCFPRKAAPYRAVPSRSFASIMASTTASTSPSTSAPPPDRRPVVISGPSGVGKGTLFKRLFAAHPGAFALSVSHTTRSPRAGEADGVDYHFVTADEFEDLAARGGFVEHARFGSNRYGTSRRAIEDQAASGKVVVLDIEMEGVKQIKQSAIDARFVFVKPPSFEELERRLRGRGTESEEAIAKRLAQARVELDYADTPGVHDLIIVNDDLDAAYRQLEDFVYKPPPQ
ncbi:P-loop containing nucleoside triphosphate hydrolase protein [Biscogniauxia sp. FL1348]|nr:P-loop containing nucleoside triphosphate hydrolase protein [Biscogniauxia sp. FL1348]